MAIEIITTVLVPAPTPTAPTNTPQPGPYDLTDLATTKDELDIKIGDRTKDAFIQRALSQVSIAIQSYCDRIFQVQTYKDVAYPQRDAYPYQVPGGVFSMQAKQWPILPTLLPLVTAIDAPGGNVLTFASVTGVSVGMPVHAPNPLPDGAALPGFPYDLTVSSVNATANTVTLSASLTADVPEGTMVNFGPRVVVQDPAGTWCDLILGTDYLIDAEKGWWIRLNKWTGYPSKWDPVQTTLRYQAGFASIPLDLVEATLREVTGRFYARGRDPMLRSRSQPGGLGEETYWVGTRPGVRGHLTEEVAGMLDIAYRVPTVA